MFERGAAADVAAKNPQKVKEREKLFWTEAKKYQVMPLDTTFATRVATPRPNLSAGRTHFSWTGKITGTPEGDGPPLLDTSYTYKAEIEVPKAGADGMIVTAGGRVLNVTGIGATAAEARDRAYAAAERVEFDGKQMRHDIAARAVDRVEA